MMCKLSYLKCSKHVIPSGLHNALSVYSPVVWSESIGPLQVLKREYCYKGATEQFSIQTHAINANFMIILIK